MKMAIVLLAIVMSFYAYPFLFYYIGYTIATVLGL